MENQDKKMKLNKIRLIVGILFYISSIIFIIMTINTLNDADYYISGGAKLFGDVFDSMSRKYVGGDAYNYIIAGAYSTTITIRALICALFACSSAVIGVLIHIPIINRNGQNKIDY